MGELKFCDNYFYYWASSSLDHLKFLVRQFHIFVNFVAYDVLQKFQTCSVYEHFKPDLFRINCRVMKVSPAVNKLNMQVHCIFIMV